MRTHAFLYLFIAIVVVGALGQLYFVLGAHTPAKRRWYPWWVAAVSAMFALAPLVGDMPWGLTLMWWAAVVLNGGVLVKATRFCDACGTMRVSLWRNNLCSRCGAALPKDSRANASQRSP